MTECQCVFYFQQNDMFKLHFEDFCREELGRLMTGFVLFIRGGDHLGLTGKMSEMLGTS